MVNTFIKAVIGGTIGGFIGVGLILLIKWIA